MPGSSNWRRPCGKFVKKKVAIRLQNLREHSKKPSEPEAPQIQAIALNNEHSYCKAIDTINKEPQDIDIDYVPSDLLPLSFCRFIVELDYLSRQLKTCQNCNNPVFLHKALGVRPYGVCGLLYIKCDCGTINKIRLGKTHHTGRDKRGVGVFDVNTKAAAGMLHAGIGESQVNNFLSSMNVHCLDSKALRAREHEVGAAMERSAEESERRYLREEEFQSETGSFVESQLDTLLSAMSMNVDEAATRLSQSHTNEPQQSSSYDTGIINEYAGTRPSLTGSMVVERVADESLQVEELQRPSILTGVGEFSLNDCAETRTGDIAVENPNECAGTRSSNTGDIQVERVDEILHAEELQRPSVFTDNQEERTPGISLSTDTCWQKKGSGRSYNSLSGVASLIGQRTGKVVKHAIRFKQCRICDSAKKSNTIPKAHKCKQNWTGTAKGMEPDMVVELLRSIDAENIAIKEVAGDDDTTGFDRAKQILSHSNMTKASDRNHVKKNVVKHLIDIKRKHKELSAMVMNSICKNFSFMIDQNQGDKTGIEKGLKAVTNHPFGDHTFCSSSWCGFLKNKDGYKHSNLPYGKDLSSKALKDDLERLFLGKLMNHADKLTNLSSSQANESLNNIFASKAPKSKHYSSSASLSYRVCSGVLQKNDGYTYIPKLNESIGLSPGNISMTRSKMLDRKRQRRAKKAASKDSKKQRLLLKKKRTSTNASLEVREGTLYESEIAFNRSDDEELIPPAPEAVVKDSHGPILVFDLETTGLSRKSDITQIAAYSEERSFDTYILPSQPITREAASVTKIRVHNNQMYHENKAVPFKLPHEALTDFLSFLEGFKNPPVLVGHNIKRFDCHVLFYSLKFFNMWSDFVSKIVGFIDTLDVIKHVYPDLKSYSQSSLVCELLNTTYNAHDAREDTKLLYRLVMTKCNLEENRNNFLFSKNYAYDFYKSTLNLASFTKAIEKNAVSKAMALKAAKSGLCVSHLMLAIQRNGIDGLRALLSEQLTSGKVRVTNSKKIIQKLYEFLNEDNTEE